MKPQIGMRVVIDVPGFAGDEGVVTYVHRNGDAVTVNMEDLGVRDFSWCHVTPLADEVKGEMTDAEFLRLVCKSSEWHPESATLLRLNAIADLLGAMKWRDEPPDSVGDWIRHRLGYIHITVDDSLAYTGGHHSGDLWLKLPETVT